MPLHDRRKGWPWWAYAALLAGVAALVWLLWWLLLGRADSAAQRATEAKAGQVQGEAKAEAGAAATGIIERHYETTREIERIRNVGLAEIQAAPDAAAAGAATRRALCLLDPAGYADEPACAVQRVGAAGPAKADTGRSVPDR